MKTQEGVIRLGNTTADYVAFGSGTRPMVMIPGLNLRDVKGSGILLARTYRLFCADFRVYCIDKKKKISEGCTIADLAEDYAQAMEELNIRGACVLGVSQGGMIGQCLAAAHPELVDRLVLGVTAARANDTLTTVIGNWVRLAQEDRIPEMIMEFIPQIYSSAYVEKYRRVLPLLAKVTKPSDPVRFIRLAQSCLTWDFYDRLEQIRCPVLVLGGAQDQVLTGEASEEIARRLNCPIHIYPDLGHSAYEEAPDFNQRAYDFFMH